MPRSYRIAIAVLVATLWILAVGWKVGALATAHAATDPVAAHIERVCRPMWGDQGAKQKARAYAGLIRRKAAKYHFDPGLLVALVWHESNFNPHTVSYAGAQGLGQVMPGHFRVRRIPRSQWHDPETNLDLACQLLAEYRREVGLRYRTLTPGDLTHRTLVAYNMGPRAVSRGRFRSRYSSAVMATARKH